MALWSNPAGETEWGLSDAQRQFAEGLTPEGAQIVRTQHDPQRFNIIVNEPEAPAQGKEAKNATSRA